MFQEYIGQSSNFVGKKTKGERRGEEDGGLGEGSKMEDWTRWLWDEGDAVGWGNKNQQAYGEALVSC